MTLTRPLLCALLILLSGLSAAQDILKVTTPFVAPKRWALVIGASKYEHFGSLDYAAADANSFGKALVEAYGFEPGNVRLLTDADGAKPESLPTTANISAELDKILNNRALNKGDLFVFYFAGHGIGTSNGDYLVPADATKQNAEKVGLPVKNVIAQIVAAGLKNVLVICDACRAGKENPFGAELQTLGKKANIAVLLGCAPGRRSYEYPNLGHGIFTYMLEKAMRSEALRDARTGALWASAIAKKVQADVSAYTERDYGQDKQVPSTWSEASTFDVLIGAYIGKDQIAQLGMAELMKMGKGVNKQSFAFYLRALGVVLFVNGQFLEAVESFRTLEQLGEAAVDDRVSLASCLMALGRDGEATKIYLEVIKTDPDSSSADMAILSLGRTHTTEAQRRRAAKNIWTATKTWINAYTYWITLAFHDPVEARDRKPILSELLAHFGAETRAGFYFQASNAYLENDLATAMSYLSKCVDAPGTEPERNDTLILFYQIADRLGDEKLIDRIIQSAKADPKHRLFWQNIEVMRLDKMAAAERIRSIETLLAASPSAQSLLMLTVQAGRQASDLLPKIREVAKAHPFAWESHLSIWLAEEASTGFKYPPREISPSVFKYGPSDIEVRKHAWSNYAEMLEVAETTYDVRNQFNRYFARDLLRDPNVLGPRWQVWDSVQSYLNDMWLHLELGWIGSKHIAPLVKKGEGGLQLRELLLECYIGASMWKEAEVLVKSNEWHGTEARGGDLRWAISLAMLGRDAEARQQLSRFKPIAQKSVEEMAQALGLLLDAREGKAGTLEKIKSTKPKNLIAQQLLGLGQFQLEMPTAAQPSTTDLVNMLGLFNTLTPLVINVNELYRDVHAACLVAFDRLSRYSDSTSKDPKPDDLPAAIAMEHYGNGLYAQLHFGLKPGLDQFVGEQVWEGTVRANLSDEVEEGSARINVSKFGVAQVVMGPSVFKGTVDAFGTLRAAGSVKGKKATLYAKIPPPGHESKNLKSIAPRLLIISEDGQFGEFLRKSPKEN
ncbi:MAG TPA: caspase family protein [Fimbriimonadaceae bacterium]|nr:caspase family protein [Fimbriimonadaceae bacterium]